MAWSEQPRRDHASPGASPGAQPGARRVAVVVIASLFVVLTLGFAPRTTGSVRADAVGAVSAPAGFGRVSVAGGSAARVLLSWSRPVGHRRVARGDLGLGVAAVAAAFLFITQARRGARRGPRFDAVFVFRRGPPVPSFAD